MQNILLCPYCRSILCAEKDRYFCAKCIYGFPILENSIISFVKDTNENNNFNERMCNNLLEMEKKHFWHIGRKEIIISMLKIFISDCTNNVKMLEVGCGNGSVLRYLKKEGIDIEGVDVSLPGLKFCRKQANIPLYQLDVSITALPFISECYDIVGMFDLIEHINNDQQILEEVYRCCKKNGFLIVTVPANKYLWSYFDIIAGHKRRYSKKEIERKLYKAGFKVEKISFYVFFLFPIIFLMRKLHSLNNRKRNIQINNFIEIQTIPLLNSFFLMLMRLEKKILPFINLPWGTSLIVVAKKTNDNYKP